MCEYAADLLKAKTAQIGRGNSFSFTRRVVFLSHCSQSKWSSRHEDVSILSLYLQLISTPPIPISRWQQQIVSHDFAFCTNTTTNRRNAPSQNFWKHLSGRQLPPGVPRTANYISCKCDLCLSECKCKSVYSVLLQSRFLHSLLLRDIKIAVSYVAIVCLKAE